VKDTGQESEDYCAQVSNFDRFCSQKICKTGTMSVNCLKPATGPSRLCPWIPLGHRSPPDPQMKTPAAAATDIHVHPDGTANDPVDGTELDE